MEQFDYLVNFGDCVKQIRKAKKMTQVEFYRFLYPEEVNGEENIKKTMNKIEHGKSKYLNTDLIIRFCQKCDVSADYLLGISKDYKNHEMELVCEYTGLEDYAVNQLHEWNIEKNNGSDISKIGEAFFEEDEEEHLKMYRKQDGIAFLRIVNYLFKSGTRKNRKRKGGIEKYSNVKILYALYLLSMAKPKEVFASFIPDEYTKIFNEKNPFFRFNNNHVPVDLNQPISMYDNNHILYVITPKDTLERIGREQLDEGVEWLIEQIKREDDTRKNKPDSEKL